MNHVKLVILGLSILIIFVLVFYFAYLRVDTSDYFKYLTRTMQELSNQKLANLLNANSLLNLPVVKYTTNNLEIDHMQKCQEGPVYLGPNTSIDYTQMCFNTCGSGGSVVLVDDVAQYFFNNVQLNKGAWCVIKNANCNMRTGYVTAGINQAVCRTKYPNMFGGSEASTIVACNNEFYPDTQSVLWDNLMNERVDPFTVNMTNENETLPDGTYRFTCRYGNDENLNPYLPHPLNRFQPIQDPCNKSIFAASAEVTAVVDESGWRCECGDFESTRVQHKTPGDPKSTCTACLYEHTENTYKVPFDCYTLNSPFTALYNKTMCNIEKYTRQGNLCETVTFKISEIIDSKMLPVPTTPQYTYNLPENLTINNVTYYKEIDYLSDSLRYGKLLQSQLDLGLGELEQDILKRKVTRPDGLELLKMHLNRENITQMGDPTRQEGGDQ